jgi:hypothetical protein
MLTDMGLTYSRVAPGHNLQKVSPRLKTSPFFVLPPELRQQILLYIIGENNIAHAVFSTTCRARPCMLWPMHDQNLDGLASTRQKILKRTLQETGFIRPTIKDWTIIEELFGEDLNELLKTCWKQLIRKAVSQGMLEILDGSVHNIGCNKHCLETAHANSFQEYKRWSIRRRKSVSNILCF